MVLISLYSQAATAWALGQIGRHTPEHAKAVALTNVLESLLFCCRNSASSEDLQAKVTMLAYHLPKNSGTFGQNVNVKIILTRATRKFFKGSPKFPTEMSERKMCVAILDLKLDKLDQRLP